MSITTIEWTDRTWNPTRGCSRVSEGCRNCYAERQAARFAGITLTFPELGPPKSATFHGFVQIANSHPQWTGRVELIESKLMEPLHWRKPCRVFVNSMSDLFHEALPDEAIDRVFAVMALCPQHTFQILTKRPERMLEYFRPDGFSGFGEHIMIARYAAIWSAMEASGISIGTRTALSDWPLPNVWLGVSVENQATADERIPPLLQTPAAVRFVSYEPALGPVDFERHLGIWRCSGCGEIKECSPKWRCTGRGWAHLCADNHPQHGHEPATFFKTLDWLICGGESGPGARPFDIAWARSARDQCRAAGVAFFMKQVGAKPFNSESAMPRNCKTVLRDRKGGDISEWPEDLRIRQFPNAGGGSVCVAAPLDKGGDPL